MRTAGWTGLSTKMKSCPSPCASSSKLMMEISPEKNMTLQFGQSCLIRTASSMPVICGIITSVIRRSGDLDRAAFRAASGSAKECASKPWFIKMSSRVEAMTFSSSTTNTRCLSSDDILPTSVRLVSLPIEVGRSYALLPQNSVQYRTVVLVARRSIGTMEGRNMLDTRFTAIDSSHWTITRETIKLGEVTRDQYRGFRIVMESFCFLQPYWTTGLHLRGK